MKRLIALAAVVPIMCVMAFTYPGSSNTRSSSPTIRSTPSAAITSTMSAAITSTTSAACRATPTYGGTLTYARQTATLSINPFEPVNGNGDIFADTLLYEGLVMPDPKGKTNNLLPAVASSWQISNGGKTYTLNIRPGIRFSNGQLVTAADVKYSLDTFANPKLDADAALAYGYKSTTVVNRSTVRMQLTERSPAILNSLSILGAFIVPANLVRSEGASFWSHPVGTGPFRFSSWVKGSSITFTKNPYYWQKGHPYLDKVVYDFASNDNSRILDLETHQAQEIDGVPYSEVPSLTLQSNLVLHAAQIPEWVMLWVNHQVKPFQSLDVRQAMEYALNRVGLNKEIFDGLGTIPNSILPHFALDAPNSKVAPYPYDLAKAKKLMHESAFPHGFNVTLNYPSGSSEYATLALVLQSEWAPLGIKLTLRSDDQPTLVQLWTTGRYDIIFPYTVATGDIPVPDEFAGLMSIYDGDYGFYTWWKDPTITAMVIQYLHASDSARAQEWPRIQAALQQQTPEFNLLDLPLVTAHLSNVCGVYNNPLGADSLQYTWLAK